MGSYDFTCALSDLPIRSGDPVVIQPIGQRLHQNKPASDWRPIAAPARAHYNDYGWVEDLSTTPFHEAWVQSTSLNLSANDFFEQLSEGSILMEDSHGEKMLSSFCMIRVDAWNSALELPIASWNSGIEIQWNAAIENACASGARQLAALEHIVESAEISELATRCDSGDYSIEQLTQLLINGYAIPSDPRSGANALLFSELASRHSSTFDISGYMPEAMCYRLALLKPSPGDYEQALRDTMQSRGIDLAMDALRRTLSPARNIGPQRGAVPIHYLWHKHLARLASNSIDWNESCHDDGFALAKAEREKEVISSSLAQPRTPRI